MKMRVTAKDVAKLANVSEKTVSRVVNNQGEISETTREKVLAAIKKLRYRPNWAARNLARGNSRTIGIIIPDITDPFFPEVILGAESAAREQGYGVFLCNTNRTPDLEMQYIEALYEKGVDGLLIAGSVLSTDQLEELLEDREGIVLTPYTVRSAIVFSVDDTNGVQQLGRHLISLGHRQIAFIDAQWTNNAHHRRTGLGQAFTAEHLPLDDIAIESTAELTIEGGRKACLEILSKYPKTTAIVCHNDVLALGALEACRESDIKVPADISVVGFDDIPEASRSHPPLTTFHFDRKELGSNMIKELVNRLCQKTSKLGKRIVVPGKLIVRSSTSKMHCNRSR